jgi:hypothetical protein
MREYAELLYLNKSFKFPIHLNSEQTTKVRNRIHIQNYSVFGLCPPSKHPNNHPSEHNI